VGGGRARARAGFSRDGKKDERHDETTKHCRQNMYTINKIGYTVDINQANRRSTERTVDNAFAIDGNERTGNGKNEKMGTQ
jgi:hypothetical protein